VPYGASVLILARRKPIVLLALLALFLGQSAAQFHALTHAGDRSVPGTHAPLCSDCVSHAPLLAMGGAVTATVFAAVHAFAALRAGALRSPDCRTVHHAFRSRAPPR
jgi:hypothetical protein